MRYEFDYSPEKDAELKERYDIGFQEIINYIDGGNIWIQDHPNQKDYPNQQIFYVQVVDYIYVVPFVEDENKIFLKTLFPSRKATKYFLEWIAPRPAIPYPEKIWN